MRWIGLLILMVSALAWSGGGVGEAYACEACDEAPDEAVQVDDLWLGGDEEIEMNTYDITNGNACSSTSGDGTWTWSWDYDEPTIAVSVAVMAEPDPFPRRPAKERPEPSIEKWLGWMKPLHEVEPMAPHLLAQHHQPLRRFRQRTRAEFLQV